MTIEELESLNLQLEQRCERAELQVTKLRMDAIGKEAEYGSFESGYMSTEDNIIMRMFSPPARRAEEEKIVVTMPLHPPPSSPRARASKQAEQDAGRGRGRL